MLHTKVPNNLFFDALDEFIDFDFKGGRFCFVKVSSDRDSWIPNYSRVNASFSSKADIK